MSKVENVHNEQKKSFQPPDGGWGWMVVLGSALTHAFIIPILQNFTLIFKDYFAELGFTSTNITTLVSLNASFGMILGFANGPLLKAFGYRKVALVGMTIYFIGMICTGIASSYIEFIIFYGLLTSYGLVIIMASFSLAVNSYFLKNRSKAVGYTMTLMGLGPIIMPFVISYLLASYGLKWAIFLLSGLSLHGYVGAFLLRPLKKHAQLQRLGFHQETEQRMLLLPEVHSIVEMPAWGSNMSLRSDYTPAPTPFAFKSEKATSTEFLEGNKEIGKELQGRRKLSLTFLDNEDYRNMMNSTLQMVERMEIFGKIPKHASAETLSVEHLTDHERSLMEPLTKLEKIDFEANKDTRRTSAENPKCELVLRVIRFLKDLYDLDLFHDLSYVNIILGLSLAFTGEVIFSTMTPIILKEVGFNTEESATFMSTVAGCDLLFRFIAPFVGKRLNLDSKKMYLISLTMLLISRASMYLASTHEMYLLVSVGLGIGKGFRSVFWVLVLPDYVPLSKLASASAFQSLTNGILLLMSGPIIGAVTGLSKNYLSIIVATNILTLATILLWCGEIIYLKYKKKNLMQVLIK